MKELILKQTITNIFNRVPTLNKDIFEWDKLPSNIKVLASTDTSGIVQYKGIKYYVYYDLVSDSVKVELN